MLPDDVLPLTPEETHRLRHYTGLTALHIGFAVRSVMAEDFWNAARNHEMAMEAMRLATRVRPC